MERGGGEGREGRREPALMKVMVWVVSGTQKQEEEPLLEEKVLGWGRKRLGHVGVMPWRAQQVVGLHCTQWI